MVKNQEKLAEISVQTSISLLHALKKMDETGRKLLLVFDDNTFTGLLSIGDIQRAIINNKPLNTPLTNVLRPNIRVASSRQPFSEIKSTMQRFRTECMPVLNENRELIDVYFWEDVFPDENDRIKRNLGLPVVIMAGGKGTRLKPITNVLPKPLIPVGEKTILENIMDRFLALGCSNFFLSVNYKAEMIKHYFDNLNSSDYGIQYITEEKPLGTAGSLYLLKGKLDSTFFVSNCDIIIDEDYGEIYDYHINNGNDLTIVAALRHFQIPYGTLETSENGLLERLEEKPEITFKINSGLYILEAHILDEIPENEHLDITELIQKIKNRKGKIGVFPVSEKSWTDIGTWDQFLSFKQVR